MNRKTFLVTNLVLGMICCGSLVAWGIYLLANNPIIQGGIQQVGNEFSAMSNLQQKLAQTYQCNNVNVQLMNGNTLNISFINSEFINLRTTEQAKRAEEVARFVKANYAGKAKVTRIVIIFVESKNLGPLNMNRSSSYPFETNELDPNKQINS